MDKAISATAGSIVTVRGDERRLVRASEDWSFRSSTPDADPGFGKPTERETGKRDRPGFGPSFPSVGAARGQVIDR